MARTSPVAPTEPPYITTVHPSTSCLHPTSTQQGRFLQLLSSPLLSLRAAGEHKRAAVLFIQPLPFPSLQSSWCAGFQQASALPASWESSDPLVFSACCHLSMPSVIGPRHTVTFSGLLLQQQFLRKHHVRRPDVLYLTVINPPNGMF